ncbi:MAG: tRNA-dependent cyclodipeptide synthase [Candidatus Kaiserbacteria bacterium]|nr:tRNA-dependent cyclodipeptide synthase [Candidatus Kaiserbacteria bacterium]MCB9816484.1 tRNA-dependent cyclodipeptide synthase [Candidatus Nomurabacteria bacterium]
MQYFNVSEKEVEQKMFNIFVGISLGNKLLTPELARHYVEWAHKYTNKNAVILIADKIDAVNWQVFRGLSEAEALEKAAQKGYGVAGMFDKARRTLARETGDMGYISNVHVIFWEDIYNWGYDMLRGILEKEYWENSEFQNAVLHFVDKYIELRDVDVSDEDKHKLAGYIIDELPTLLGGIYWDNTLYNLILYPTYVDSGMSQFVLDIRGGKYFDASKLQLRQISVLVEDYLKKPDDLSVLNQ